MAVLEKARQALTKRVVQGRSEPGIEEDPRADYSLVAGERLTSLRSDIRPARRGSIATGQLLLLRHG